MRATMMMLLLLLVSTSVFAKGPAGQGRVCDTRSKCEAGLSCVAHRDGKSTCEIACASGGKCPEDQRCVKDAGEMVCRPINDSVGLATTELKTPPAQGRACDAKNRCDGELQCVKHRDGAATCELVCATSAKCPEDQRCVKDAEQMLCRPITNL